MRRLSCIMSFLKRAIWSFKFLAFLAIFIPFRGAHGQETVFDVPSADVLDQGKVYGELDGTVRPVDPLATFTPRVVVGIGHQIEVGVNFNGLSAPTLGPLAISPTVKWRIWKTRRRAGASMLGMICFFRCA